MLYRLLTYVRLHLPALLAIALVVVNALVDNGTVNLSDHAINVLNAVLVSLGVGVIHKRQLKG